MDPTMAMAPTHTTREAVTKPWTNWLSPRLSALALSQMPRCSIFPSKSKNSPTRVPSARARIMERVAAVPREATLPSWTVRGPCQGPCRPDEEGAQPHGLHEPLLVVGLEAAPDHQAHGAPRTMAATLAMVPVPIMARSPFFRAVALVYQISPGRGSLLALCRGRGIMALSPIPCAKGGFPMKRTLLALLVGLSLLLSLAACGSERASAQEVTEQGLAALRDLDVLAPAPVLEH